MPRDLLSYRWQEEYVSHPPEGERYDVWHYRSLIQQACNLPNKPPHDLTPEIADEIRFVRNDIAIALPENFSRRDAFSLFLTHENPMGTYYMLDDLGDIAYDQEKELAAIQSSSYLPGYWDLEPKELMDSYHRSLDPQKKKREGSVDFPTNDRVSIRLGIRRTQKPAPKQVVEGLFYEQFFSDEWNWEYGAPQLFAAIEKNLESRTVTDDPFEWVQERISIAAGYSILGGGKECSPPFLAQAYERMASTVCNGIPVGHEEFREYEIGEEEQNLLIELYGRYASSLSPEMVEFVMAHAVVLTPQILRESEHIKKFLTHLPEMLSNGLNIDRVFEYAIEPTKESGTGLQRLESALRMTMSIYRGEKPWWFKEDFSMSEWLQEDDGHETNGRLRLHNNQLGRATLERIAQRAGFAFTHVLEPYHAVGYRMGSLPPFTEEDAIDFTAFVTEHYGIGNRRRSIEVIRNCLYILEQEALPLRHERLKNLREHLDEVKPQTHTIGRLEARDPVFEMPGVHVLTATMLRRSLAESMEVHDLRIGFDILEAIDEKFQEPLEVRARTYAPALPSHLANMQRRGLLINQSPEARLALPIPEGHLLANVERRNPSLGIFDFYAQLKQECGQVNRDVAKIYFQHCAARMPDPWHPPKGFLRFLELFDFINTPGWRFTAMEHPRDRPKVSEQNQRREVAKQMLVSNMLDAWIMGLLTSEELEALCRWITAELTDEERIEIEKDVLWSQNDDLAKLNLPLPPPVAEDEPEDIELLTHGRISSYMRRQLRRPLPPKPVPTEEEREQEAMERLEMNVRSECQQREQRIRSQRMVALQETFTMLSVLNSMAIAGSFSIAELRSVLRETVLPAAIRGADQGTGEVHAIQQGAMLTNLVRMQELGGIDHQGFRSAIEGSASPEEARKTAYDFIQQVLLRCMEESLNEALPNAINTVTSVMKAHAGKPDTAEGALARAVGQARKDLETELRRIWNDAPFAAPDIVERLLREFRVPEYVELFGPLQEFNARTLPRLLPEASRDPRHRDLQDSNEHSARMFYFIGSRMLQEQHLRDEDNALDTMRERYGESSHVNMTGGTSLMNNLSSGIEDDGSLDRRSQLRDFGNRLPDFQQHVDQWRLDDVPLGPIGGRWHFGNPVTNRHLELFTHLLSLGRTPFRMIHSNESLIIPGFMSKNEMRMFILMLAMEGLIDPKQPELQIGITGRLAPELCAYFGSSCMLGTADCAAFKLDSFVPESKPNHELTAARIVAYDAYPESEGKRRNFELPFMFQGSPEMGNVPGRTDILGRWNVRWNTSTKPDLFTMDDLDITHIVGSALRHVQHGGPLKEAGLAYMERHREILERYGITDTLDAPWVYTRVHEAYEDSSKNPEHFNRCVKACMDVHFASAESFSHGTGAVFEVRKNIDTLMRQAETIGKEVLRDPRYENDVRALLQARTYESLHS